MTDRVTWIKPSCEYTVQFSYELLLEIIKFHIKYWNLKESDKIESNELCLESNELCSESNELSLEKNLQMWQCEHKIYGL